MADFVLKHLVTPVADRYCFASFPDYSDNAYFMYRYLLRSKGDKEIVWVVFDQSVIPQIHAELSKLNSEWQLLRLIIVPWRSLKGYWYYLTSSYVFHTVGLYTFSQCLHRRLIVSLWHGMPIKNIAPVSAFGEYPERVLANVYLATSEFYRGIMARAFEVEEDRVYICSQPRCVPLLDMNARIESRRLHSIGLRDQEKFVLWMPTYRDRVVGKGRSFLDDLQAGFAATLFARLEHHGVRLVIKLHPYEQASCHRVQHSFPNALVFDNQQWADLKLQLYDVLAHSTGLISDISSVMIDYMLTRRPIGMFGFNPNSYSRSCVIQASELQNSDLVFDLTDMTELERFSKKTGAGEILETSALDISRKLNDGDAPRGEELLIQFCRRHRNA